MGKKKSPPTYVENIDFLIGSNPIEGILQGWLNADRYPLNFTSQVFTGISVNGAFNLTVTDAEFYFVIAVTWEYLLTGTFNDYGGPGPIAYSVTSEYPLWNAMQHGPDLLNGGASKYYPWVYVWEPSDGTTVRFPFATNEAPQPWQAGFTGKVTIYYAQLSADIKHHSPANRMCLTFESELGDGTEYSDAGLSSQQIIYPQYAGVGSPDFDLGTAGVIPSVSLEIKGSFARFHPRGDADFCDMIEDIIKSGLLQVGSELGLIQRGVNMNTLPGPIQVGQKQCNIADVHTVLVYYQPNTAGNQLVAAVKHSSGTATISDTAGDSWNPVYNSNGYSVWTATSVGSAARNTVTTDNLSGGIRSAYILELDPGSTVLDGTAVFTGSSGSPLRGAIPCTGQPTYVLAIIFGDSGWQAPQGWTEVFPRKQNTFVYSQVVAKPGVCTFNVPIYGGGTSYVLIMLAYKSAQPVPYPAALGDITDEATLDMVRDQCWAGGLIGSVVMDSQKAAADWLKEIYQCADAAPVWSGFVLKSIPRSEVSAVGNGRIYTAYTAAGPVATLTESDLIGDASQPLVTIERKAQVDTNNILQTQYFDRNSDYNQSTASEPLAGAIALYGPRKEDPMTLPEIQDPLVARKVLSIEVRRRTLLRNTYKFTMMAKWAALEAMDLILINEPKLNLVNFPVRLTSIKENDKYELECEAEPFYYGCNAPDVLTVTSAAPYQPSTGGDPGQVNTPIIFEPVPRLTSQQNQAQIWCVVSGSSANYGGCVVLISTDGGSSYPAPVGIINGNAVTGVTTADWPANADPDTSNDLPVDLTESLGALLSYQTDDRDNFVYPCYVDGGVTCIPYELMTYNMAVLTSAYNYTLLATGTSNELRRAVFGAPQVGMGVDHPMGSRFAFLNPAGIGIFKINMDPLWAGKTLYFKFLAFNTFGNNEVAQADATPYTYTPSGCPAQQQNPNNSNYTVDCVLTQTAATTIHMAGSGGSTTPATITFPSNQADYHARDFTISSPTAPTTYYVTVNDPAQLGDTESPQPTAYCENTTAKVGQPGYFFLGSIVALPGGGGTSTSPGGSGGIPILGLALQTDIQQEKYIYADDTGTANAYVVTLVPVPTAYVEGMGVVFKAAHANTTSSTLNVNGLGAKTILKIGGANLAAGDISAGQIVYVKYDGTNFQMISPTPSTAAGTPFGETLSVGTSSNATLSHTPNPSSFLQLTKNGIVLQQGGGDDYTLSGTAITLAVPGLVTDIFQAFYIY